MKEIEIFVSSLIVRSANSTKMSINKFQECQYIFDIRLVTKMKNYNIRGPRLHDVTEGTTFNLFSTKEMITPAFQQHR